MNHKRKRPKNRRAGCLMCKPHKMNHAGGMKLEGSRTRLAAEQTRREALAHTHQTSHG